jgi:hypothetical protein
LILFGSKDKCGAIYGLQYVEDSVTFDAFMGNQDLVSLKGGELETKIVDLVN